MQSSLTCGPGLSKASRRTGCFVGVSILLRRHATHQRAIWTVAPAITFVRNMAEAGFILKHQTEWVMITPVGYPFI